METKSISNYLKHSFKFQSKVEAMSFNPEEIPTLDIIIEDSLAAISGYFLVWRSVILTSLLTLVVTCTIYVSGQNAKTQIQLMQVMGKIRRAKQISAQGKHYKFMLGNLKKEADSRRQNHLQNVAELEVEVARLKQDLQKVTVELNDPNPTSLETLQKWLQLTYELEIEALKKRLNGIEIYVETAEHISRKLKKSKIIRPSHIDLSEDAVNHFISRAVEAKKNSILNLDAIKDRWIQIETSLGLKITQNPGIAVLRSELNHFNSVSSTSNTGDEPHSQTFKTRAAKIRSTLRVIKFFKKKKNCPTFERQISKSKERSKSTISTAIINRFAFQEKLALTKIAKR